MLEKLELTLVGVAPLLMCNGELANPLSPSSRALKVVTARRKKTEADYEEARHIEFLASLYLDADGRVAIPAENVLALVIEGARKSRHGKEASAAVFETQPFFRLGYDGPKEPEKLYAARGFVDFRRVKVSGRAVMRARARFAEWKLPIGLMVNTDILDVRKVAEAVTVAGERIGLGDYRPRFGRFTVE